MTDENINLDAKDPMYPDKPVDDGTYEEPAKDITSSIAERLGGEMPSDSADSEVTPENPSAIDITKFSREQLQTLKAMLNATPDNQKRVKTAPRVFLRRIDGKFVCDFKRAFLKLVDDPENNRKVERHVIPIKFFGEKDFTDIKYSDLINSERVACEVMSTRSKIEEFNEGETISRETGLLTEMIRKEQRNWFTIKLPTGETVEIEAKLANA